MAAPRALVRKMLAGGCLALLILATSGLAQERHERQGVLRRLVFLPEGNRFEITVQDSRGSRTFAAENRVVLLKLDSKVFKDPRTAGLARHGPVVFYIEEHQPRINKPFFSRVVIIFADVSQLKAFLTTP
ncbi:MAG: hypothetical protein ACE5I9_04100 [Candidatus Methylomirabilales bacterium]